MATNKIYWWDAPKGHKAVPPIKKGKCTGCVYEFDTSPFNNCDYLNTGSFNCINDTRKDSQNVIFVPRHVKS